MQRRPRHQFTDIGRPVSGTWTNEQKLVFNCIKEAQRNGW